MSNVCVNQYVKVKMGGGPLSEWIMSYASALGTHNLVPLPDTWVEMPPNKTDSPVDCMHPTVIHCSFQIDCQTRKTPENI